MNNLPNKLLGQHFLKPSCGWVVDALLEAAEISKDDTERVRRIESDYPWSGAGAIPLSLGDRRGRHHGEVRGERVNRARF